MMLPQQLKLLMPYVEWLAVLSVSTFLLSIILIPLYIGYLPKNYFTHLKFRSRAIQYKPEKIVLQFLKNLIGVILVFAGIVMLFIPGQGILTILIGLLCMSFPGKQSLILYLINKQSIRTSLNWTRKKISHSPFNWD